MGFNLRKATRVKLDRGTGKNLVKNIVGQTVGPAGSALGVTKFAGDLYDAATGMLNPQDGGGGGPGPVDNSASKRYEALLDEQRKKNLAANEAYTKQLQDAAEGKTPSLAGAQMKAASNRTLAQTLSAAQTAGASPLATRQLFQLRGQQSRDLSEQSGLARMQEQEAARNALGAQLANAANQARQDITSGYDIARGPIDTQFAADQARLRAQQDRDAQHRDMNTRLLGATLAAGGTLLSDEQQKQSPMKPILKSKSEKSKSHAKVGEALTAFAESLSDSDSYNKRGKALSDERQKKLPSAKKEVNSFLDELEALKYEYKDPSAPGAAPGERVGITAQDLEKSSLGSKLVQETSQGKMVDTVQGFGTVLAAQAELNRRLKKLEGKK